MVLVGSAKAQAPVIDQGLKKEPVYRTAPKYTQNFGRHLPNSTAAWAALP
jgi:hypothetical protein